tara:strand:+ start:883 stop:993 length:111 start_codon:yes stop_codon:yes gene_type:complete
MDELAQRYWKTLSRMIDENKTTKELEDEDKNTRRLE